MDPVLQELIDRIGEVTDEELATLVERRADLNDEALGAVTEHLRTAYVEARNLDAPSDEVIDSMQTLAGALREVAEEQGVRDAAAATRADEAARIDAEVAALIDPVVAETDPPEGGDDAGDEGGEPAAEPAAPAEPVAEPAPEPEAVAPPVEPVVDAPAEPVAVAADARPARPRISRLAARRPESMAPRAEPDRPRSTITASGDVPGWSAGQRLENGLSDVAVGLSEKYNAFLSHGQGGDGMYGVARVHGDYPEDRRLSSTDSVDAIMARVDAVAGREAIVASGGFCAPVTPYYDLAVVAEAARPVRDSLAGFNADRGGIAFVPPPHLSDVVGAITEWTNTTDTTPGGSTKGRVHVTCPGVTTVVTEAIVNRMAFGNFGARTFPEQVAAWLKLGLAQHSRIAETFLLTQIGSGSTAVTAGRELGAARDVLTTLDRAAAGLRNRNRTNMDLPLRCILPMWLEDMIRADLVRELPGDSSDANERLATTDAHIASFFADRQINVTWSLDGIAGQIFPTQPAAPLNAWPTVAVMYLFFEGTHLFLDGGTLDLGVVRDSTLNNTNDFEMFSETFEAVATVGVESLKITQTVCPDGTTSGAKTLTLCPPGS